MSGLYLGINRDVAIRQRAIPNIVIALASPDKIAAVLGKKFSDFFLVLSH
jgi:hypothetical protein